MSSPVSAGEKVSSDGAASVFLVAEGSDVAFGIPIHARRRARADSRSEAERRSVMLAVRPRDVGSVLTGTDCVERCLSQAARWARPFARGSRVDRSVRSWLGLDLVLLTEVE